MNVRVACPILAAVTVAALLVGGSLPQAHAAEAEVVSGELPAGLSPDDALSLELVLEAALSHDGARVAYTLRVPRAADEPNGPAWSRLYVRSSDGDDPALPFVVGEVDVSSPAFSPDDRFLAFLARRHGDEHRQVWVIPMAGGEAQRATESETDVLAFAWSPDGRHLAYVAPEARSDREALLVEKGYLPRFYEESLKHRALYLVPFAFGTTAKGQALTENVSVWQLDFAPDGRHIALGVTKRPLVDEHYMAQDIHVLDLTSRAVAPLVDPPGKLGHFRYSPDGARLAYTAASTREDHAVSHGYVVDVRSGEVRDITPPAFEGHLTDIAWEDEDELLYLAREGVWTTVSRLDLDDAPEEREVRLHARDAGVVPTELRSWPGVRQKALVADSPRHPRELFAWRDGERPRRLTFSNPSLHPTRLAEQRVVRYEARDGLEIEAILILPLRHQEGQRFPLLVDVHGGPESNYTNGWLTRYFSLGQVAAARGFGVLYPNYRGSTGRGVAFGMASYADPAGKEFDDLADGIRHLIEEGLADPDRVGLYGGSYGGYAAGWFGTYYSELVRAVVSFVGVSDLVSKRYLTDIPMEDEYVHMGKPVHETWELMLERSPIRHAEKSDAAVLLLHGDSDSRVHPSQSQELYRALKRTGNDAVRLVTYPGEGHGNRRRSGRYDAMVRMLDWFEWFVRDVRPLDGPLPPLDISERYGLDLGDGAVE